MALYRCDPRSGIFLGGLRGAAAAFFEGFDFTAANFVSFCWIILPYWASAAEKFATALF